MNSSGEIPLNAIYRKRFEPNGEYRCAVWRVLVSKFFSRFIAPNCTILDLGCGYGEFINNVQARVRLAMDMNPDAAGQLQGDVKFFLHNSAEPWKGIRENSIDLVFTSNFLEHLPDKPAIIRTLQEVQRSLKSGGLFIAMGPNAKYLGGLYWEFWDHHVPLTENSLAEALFAAGFSIDVCTGRFLPHTMSSGHRYPLALIKLYLALPFLWRLFGRQFLVIARKQ
jgi:SAM-dependent methyltransferase